MPELVALLLPGGPGFVDAVSRVWDRGDAVLPLDPVAPERYTAELLARLAPTTVVTADGVEQRREGGVGVDPGDALVIATSGTTAAPRGVVLTRDAVEYAAFATATATGVDPTARWLACLPLSHIGGFSVVSRALLTGCGLEVHPRFDAAATDAAASAGATHVSLVPTALGRIDARRWRMILLGGTSIPADRPPNTIATYGMTESCAGIVYDGHALSGVEVRVVAEVPGGSAAPARLAEVGEIGAVELRSPTLLRCYRSATPVPDGTPALEETDPVASDGWYRTGDLGSLDTDRRLSVAGRADDVIVTGGEKVWPAAVESILVRDDRVAQVAVLGAPDSEWGERVVALVVPADRAEPPRLEPLRDLVRAELPRWAAPKELRLVDSLPRTALGKIRRSELTPHPPEVDGHG